MGRIKKRLTNWSESLILATYEVLSHDSPCLHQKPTNCLNIAHAAHPAYSAAVTERAPGTRYAAYLRAACGRARYFATRLPGALSVFVNRLSLPKIGGLTTHIYARRIIKIRISFVFEIDIKMTGNGSCLLS